MSKKETEWEMVTRHVADAERQVSRQKQIVADLVEAHSSVVESNELLSLLEASLSLHREHLKRLQAERS
jgi:hypothetical protein